VGGVFLLTRKPRKQRSHFNTSIPIDHDFTEIREFVVLDEHGRFLTLASPAEIRRALAKAVPKLEMAYLESREQAHEELAGGEVDRIIGRYQDAIRKIFGKPELDAKQVLTPGRLRELGVKSEGEVIEKITGEHQPFAYPDLLRRRARYLIVMRDGGLEGVIDRAELASRVASTVL
jgi:hypothetical protein